MSTRAKGVFIGSVVFSAVTVFAVHYSQEVERDVGGVMYDYNKHSNQRLEYVPRRNQRSSACSAQERTER